MIVKIISEMIVDIPIITDDVVNSDTIGEYTTQINCDIGNSALDYLANKVDSDIKIISTEPYDEGIEDYELLLNNYQSKYKKYYEKETF